MKPRIIIGAIACVLAVLFLTGCADNAPVYRVTADPARATLARTRFQDVELNGFEFVVADTHPHRWIPEPGSSNHANRVIARNMWVENELLLYAITYIEFCFYNEFPAAMLAGDFYSHITITRAYWAAVNAMRGTVLNMAAIPYFDFFEEYHWTDFNPFNILNFHGTIVGKSASFAPQTEATWMTFFNRRLIEELGLDCPHELVFNGEWTFEAMRDMAIAARADTQGRGIYDRFGMSTNQNFDVTLAMFIASGLPMSEWNDELQGFTFSMNNPRHIETVNQIRQIWQRGVTVADAHYNHNAFMEGRALFYVSNFRTNDTWMVFDMEDDFGIVPMPMGDAAQEADRFFNWVYHHAPSIAVPTTVPDDELWKVAAVMDALAFLAYDEEVVRFQEMTLSILRDRESYFTLSTLIYFGASDFFAIARFLDMGHDTAFTIGHMMFRDAAHTDPVSEIARLTGIIETGLRDSVTRLALHQL